MTTRLRNHNSNTKAFSLVELLVGIALVGVFFAVVASVMKTQARQQRYAYTKFTMEQLRVRADQAVKRFISFEMDNFLNLNPDVKSCFEARGVNCESHETLAFPGYVGAVAGSREEDLNFAMNGQYRLSGVRCNAAPCELSVVTTWSLDCNANSCLSTKISSSVEIVNAALNDSDKEILTSIKRLSVESVYNKTRQIGLVRSIAVACDVPTSANLSTNIMDCTTFEPGNTNELFDTNLGVSFLNGELKLAGATTGTTTGDPCPECTISVPGANGMECRPSVLCTNPGWIVRGCQCCNPTIPDGGNGWDLNWSNCSVQCGGGTRSRTCSYAKEDGYCDSTCSRGETQTEDCNTQACCSVAGAVVQTRTDIPGNLARAEVVCEKDDSSPPSRINSEYTIRDSRCCSGFSKYMNGKKKGNCSGNRDGKCRFCGQEGGVEYDGWDLVCI